MSQSSQHPSGSPEPDNPLDTAFEALKTYDTGSGRAALWTLDDEVRHALGDVSARIALEQRLIRALQAKPSAVASQYICSKLALVGSELCVAALVGLLPDPLVSTAARNALERIPGASASKALRHCLPSLQGLQKIGVIQSLGAKRDASSVGKLAGLLKELDPEVATAAAYSLGQIANVKAGKVLLEFLSSVPEALRPKIAAAALACAGRLLTEGHQAEARRLYTVLAAPSESPQIRQAAARALTNF